MIVPYADAAALMLANVDRANTMSRRRAGLALPVGMRGSTLAMVNKKASDGSRDRRAKAGRIDAALLSRP